MNEITQAQRVERVKRWLLVDKTPTYLLQEKDVLALLDRIAALEEALRGIVEHMVWSVEYVGGNDYVMCSCEWVGKVQGDLGVGDYFPKRRALWAEHVRTALGVTDTAFRGEPDEGVKE